MEVKKSEEILAEIYRNCHLALESISDILPETEDEELKAEIMRQHEEYERISGEAACIAKNKALDLKEPNPIKKAMMWSSIKMNTLTDNSRAHIAQMMIQGTVMGITSLKTSFSEKPEDDDEEITALLKELISLEEDFEKKLKGVFITPGVSSGNRPQKSGGLNDCKDFYAAPLFKRAPISEDKNIEA